MTSYNVEIKDKPELSELAAIWQSLSDSIADLSFFQSWAWVDNWLSVYQPDVLMVTAHYDGEVVAIGLFGKTRERRHGILSSKQLRLFQTGNSDEDQTWVEFNDIIARPAHRREARKACLTALLSETSGYDELVISMILRSEGEKIIGDFPTSIITLDSPRYRTSLEKLRDDGSSYLESLNRNTRYQINRSNRRYTERYGELALTFAQNVKQSLEYLDEAGKLHLQRWPDSGFGNPKFVKLHERFISSHFDDGLVDVIRVTAGNRVIAVLYNMVFSGTVYFYLQGLRPEDDDKMKPGLSSHAMLIEHYLQGDVKYYDFMGGESQYKRQLSQPDDELMVIRIPRPLIKFKIEQLARRLKQQLTR